MIATPNHRNPVKSHSTLGLSSHRTPARSWPRSRRSGCFLAEPYPLDVRSAFRHERISFRSVRLPQGGFGQVGCGLIGQAPSVSGVYQGQAPPLETAYRLVRLGMVFSQARDNGMMIVATRSRS